jgi:hypothetical protein
MDPIFLKRKMFKGMLFSYIHFLFLPSLHYFYINQTKVVGPQVYYDHHLLSIDLNPWSINKMKKIQSIKRKKCGENQAEERIYLYRT